jgi:hypothetical protein
MGTATAIPYEKQSDTQSNRTCGAACLSMVYRSLGKEVPQAEIWTAIAKKNRFGSLASTTHLMAKDALGRGFASVAIGARHPLQILRICHESGIRAILNHRLQHDSPAGHYTVLVDIDDKNVVLHDPFFGPSRCLSHAELIELWQPYFPNSEIAGNALIGIATEPPTVDPCRFCRTPMPSSIDCPNCNQPVGLQPGGLLGCMNHTCIARMWNYVCCPACDYTWSLGSDAPQSALSASFSGQGSARHGGAVPPAEQAVAQGTPINFDRMFSAMDEFCAHILALPIAPDPQLRQQLDFISASKEKITLAYAEQQARQKAQERQVAALRETAKLRQEAHRKKMEELNRVAPPLDGNALGHALLKNLGFKS